MTTCNGSTALATHSLITWRMMLTLRSSALMCGSQRMGLMGSMLMEVLMASLRGCGPVWNLRVKRTRSGGVTNTFVINCQFQNRLAHAPGYSYFHEKSKYTKTLFSYELNILWRDWVINFLLICFCGFTDFLPVRTENKEICVLRCLQKITLILTLRKY